MNEYLEAQSQLRQSTFSFCNTNASRGNLYKNNFSSPDSNVLIILIFLFVVVLLSLLTFAILDIALLHPTRCLHDLISVYSAPTALKEFAPKCRTKLCQSSELPSRAISKLHQLAICLKYPHFLMGSTLETQPLCQ